MAVHHHGATAQKLFGFFLWFFLAGMLVSFGCAKIQAPPGGPEDKTPPEVLSVTPETGTVNVDRFAPVRIDFSEPITKDKIEDAVYISPRPSEEPEYRWEKNTLLIKWTDSLAADITYLITVAARIADRRGNRLAEPLMMAFSTGAAIDSGTINGRVYEGAKQASSAQVLLFRLPLDSAGAVFEVPDYLTECGADGIYEFSYLPRGTYRAIAMIDKNKDRKLNLGEKAGVGAFDIELQQSVGASLPLDLYLRDVDTARFELIRCQVDPDRILRADFSHTIDSLTAHLADLMIVPLAQGDQPSIEYFDLDVQNNKQLRFAVTGMDRGVSYRLTIAGLANRDGRIVDTAVNTCEFFWPSTADTLSPQVVASKPADKDDRVDYRTSVEIRFSEPVDTAYTGPNFFMADSSGLQIEGQRIWQNPWLMEFVPLVPLDGGMEYAMTIDSGAVADRTGNVSIDRWAARFTTLQAGDFGGIAGSLSVTRTDWTDSPIILEFLPTEKRHPTVTKVFDGSEAFEYELLAGKYTLRSYVDINTNGRFDEGRLDPFLYAEPRFAFPDTVEVRARFVTEGINLTIP